MKVITIIDTFGFLFRSFYALPPLKNKEGFPTGMITGFMNFIYSLGKDFKSDYIIFALDSEGKSFRNDIYPEYKTHRPEVPLDLKAQLPVTIDLIQKMGFKTISKDRCEADDIIASIAHIAKRQGFIVQIVSHDKDLYQLIQDNIFLFDPIKKKLINQDEVIKKFEVLPQNFVDFQALLGDSSDNIPGVKGIGKKSAASLINQFKTIEFLYENINNLDNKRWQKLLLEGKENAFISKKLASLDKNCIDEKELDFNSYTLPQINPILKVANLLKKYELNNILKKVNQEGLHYKTTIPKEYNEYKFITLNTSDKLFDILKKIPKDTIIAIDTETTGLDKTDTIVGFSFCFEKDIAYYVPIAHFYLGVEDQIDINTAKKAINYLNQFKLIAHNFKYDYLVIKQNLDISLDIFADSMILAWINDPSSNVGLDKLAKKLFNYEMISYKQITKNKQNFSEVEIELATKYGAEDALFCKKIYEFYIKITDKKLLDLLQNLEYPFIKVLHYMENIGIKIDLKYLKHLQENFELILSNLTNEIYELAGEKFNINSTKQLGIILFEKLKLPSKKKTKTGYSTNEESLKALKDKHIIIDKLLQYREIFKLYSTYIKPLYNLALLDKNQRIYTSFLQTGTATGRLSSKNPNLQNIPVRKQEGKKIRTAFIAKDNFKLVSIDYSQIELRLLAHFSKDEKLIQAFKNNEDIHLKTAIELFNDATKRDIAKSINFGLIYGMGARKLAQTLNISTKEAKEYINSYFKAFPTIKSYLTSIQTFAKENGYVETILGRIRKFDFANATAFEQSNYLREASNSVFQGSTADIIKLAMLKIYNIYKDNDEVNMLIQIHDELLFEIYEPKVNFYANEIKNIMQEIITLEVPLVANISIGDNWGELKS